MSFTIEECQIEYDNAENALKKLSRHVLSFMPPMEWLVEPLPLPRICPQGNVTSTNSESFCDCYQFSSFVLSEVTLSRKNLCEYMEELKQDKLDKFITTASNLSCAVGEPYSSAWYKWERIISNKILEWADYVRELIDEIREIVWSLDAAGQDSFVRSVQQPTFLRNCGHSVKQGQALDVQVFLCDEDKNGGEISKENGVLLEQGQYEEYEAHLREWADYRCYIRDRALEAIDML